MEDAEQMRGEEMRLTVKQRQAVINELRGQYLHTPPNEKSRILNGFADLTHLNRAYARSILRAKGAQGVSMSWRSCRGPARAICRRSIEGQGTRCSDFDEYREGVPSLQDNPLCSDCADRDEVKLYISMTLAHVGKGCERHQIPTGLIDKPSSRLQ